MEESLVRIHKRNIVLKNEIGSGSYSKVYLGTLRSSPSDHVEGGDRTEHVAVKVSNEKLTTREDSFTEIMNMAKLKHQNVVHIIGIIDNGKELPWLVMEFMGNGTVFDVVTQKDVKLRQEMILRMMADIASGMAYLHSHHDLVHGDLHSKNCFVDSNGVTKVGDFGFTSKADPEDVLSRYERIPCRTFKAALMKHFTRRTRPAHLPNFHWLPPEYLLSDCLDDLVTHKPGDVWQYGTLVFQLWASGQCPYEKLTAKQIRYALQSGTDPFDFIEIEAPITVLTLTLSCWEFQPSKRLTFDAILSLLTDHFSCLSPTWDKDVSIF